MISIFRTAALLAGALVLSACSSARAPHERGWIGGRFADVSRTGGAWEPGLPRIERDASVVGMPAQADGDSAALVTGAFDGTPLARAGVEPGDLILSVDGEPVGGAASLRERSEALLPGSSADVTFWRAGATRTARVVVGREVYEAAGTIGFGIGLSPTVDLWPFDDGIDLFGLVRVRWDHDRTDLAGPEAAYLRALAPDETLEGPRQEAIEVWLLLAGAAKGKRVLRQETLP